MDPTLFSLGVHPSFFFFFLFFLHHSEHAAHALSKGPVLNWNPLESKYIAT